jgi:hypothetical protein
MISPSNLQRARKEGIRKRAAATLATGETYQAATGNNSRWTLK